MSQIQFKGKSLVWNHHLGVEYHELVPDKSKSLTDSVSLKDNLIIHGDNLKALKALLPTYAGKVKCIYIDPPYNTGNEGWKYSDNVSSPMIKEWLGEIVAKDDLTRHDKWLCMMTPRLKMLRELLALDGAIFVSIDHNEQHLLKTLLDEIFGEGNFLGIVSVVNNLKGRSDDNYIATANDFLLAYARDTAHYEIGGFPLDEKRLDEYDQEDEHGRFKEVGFRKTGKGWKRQDRPLMHYSVYYNQKTNICSLERGTEADVEILPLTSDGKEGRWRWEKKTFIERKDKDIIVRKVRTGRYVIFTKMRLRDESGEERTLLPKSIWMDPKYDTAKGAAALREIFGEDVFENPKPVGFIEDILRIGTDKDSIILDSFAGSGSTAQATLAINNEDGGKRKFILVEMEDYADKITAERVRRVIKKALAGSFSYFELGDAIDEVGILSGKSLPSYEQMARYLFYTATGEEFDENKVNEGKNFIGSSKDYEVYLFYKPEIEYLKNTALSLDKAEALQAFSGKRRLVFAPAKYLDQEHLDKFHIDFAQLPFEIYKKAAK